MQQQIGISGLLQSGTEGNHQLVRQIADEADGIGQRHAAAGLFKVQGPGGGVEGGEQLVSSKSSSLHQGIEKRRFA